MHKYFKETGCATHVADHKQLKILQGTWKARKSRIRSKLSYLVSALNTHEPCITITTLPTHVDETKDPAAWRHRFPDAQSSFSATQQQNCWKSHKSEERTTLRQPTSAPLTLCKRSPRIQVTHASHKSIRQLRQRTHEREQTIDSHPPYKRNYTTRSDCSPPVPEAQASHAPSERTHHQITDASATATRTKPRSKICKNDRAWWRPQPPTRQKEKTTNIIFTLTSALDIRINYISLVTHKHKWNSSQFFPFCSPLSSPFTRSCCVYLLTHI